MAAVALPTTPVLDRLAVKDASPKRSTLAEPFLSVIIVNYCQWRNTARLTKQLRQSASARTNQSEIVIVDNHSPRHPLLNKLRRANGVSLRRFGGNRGFARAVNEGSRLSQGDWMLLLNPDMSAPSGFLDEVSSLAQRIHTEDSRVGIVGLDVRNSDGTAQPSCGPLPSFYGTLSGLLAPRAKRKCREIPAQSRVDVPWATGCALLIRRECMREIGGFDEDFFLYYEDVDFCRRAAVNGWKVCYEPGIQVTHHNPLHVRKVPAAIRLMTRHALLTYGIKHWPRWQSALLGSIIWMESGLRQLASRCRAREHETYINGQIRQIVGDVLVGRNKQARSRIRQAAEHLESSASAQDGKTC